MRSRQAPPARQGEYVSVVYFSLFEVEVADAYYVVGVGTRAGSSLPGADVYEGHRLVSEIPQEEEVAVVGVAAARVFLP